MNLISREAGQGGRMTNIAIKVAHDNADLFEQLKDAQVRLERARNEFELGQIDRSEYIAMTEECIRIIRDGSSIYKQSG